MVLRKCSEMNEKCERFTQIRADRLGRVCLMYFVLDKQTEEHLVLLHLPLFSIIKLYGPCSKISPAGPNVNVFPSRASSHSSRCGGKLFPLQQLLMTKVSLGFYQELRETRILSCKELNRSPLKFLTRLLDFGMSFFMTMSTQLVRSNPLTLSSSNLHQQNPFCVSGHGSQ